MRRLVIGDIHGGYRAMKQVLERANFDKDKDLLIGIGDYVDGWPDVYDTVEYLRTLPNFKGTAGNHDCFSADTEALTNNGWKFYDEITPEDKILSIDTDTGLLYWDNFNKMIVKEIDGELYHFSNQHIDMMITEKHRVLFQKRAKNETGWGSYKYDNIGNLRGRVRIPTSGVCVKKGLDLSNEEIRFIAWILTDGGVSKTKYKNRYTIYQSKEKTKAIIRKLLEDLNYSFIEKVREGKIKEIIGKKLKKVLPRSEFRLSSESSQIVKEYLPDKYPFPSFLFDMNKEQFDIFLNEVVLGDGTYYNRIEKNKTAILYGKKEFLDNIQALCVQNGMRAVLVKDTRGAFRLNISEHTSTSFDIEGKVKKVPYKGTVWCLSVPKTNFMVRRNGRPFFSGNCWLLDFLYSGRAPHIWTSQGGQVSYDDYIHLYGTELAERHKKFLASLPYSLVIDNKLFVHGGVFFDEEGVNLEGTDKETLLWDRELFKEIVLHRTGKLKRPAPETYPFDEVYIGHTTTQMAQKDFTPIMYNGFYLIDQGGGWDGKLTVMDIDTHEYWQSDFVPTLYPEVKGRD